MSAVSAEEYVQERLNSQIAYHDRKAMESQRQYRRLVILSIGATALTPLLLSLEMIFSPPPVDEPLQMVVEILPIVVSVIAAAATISLSAFKHKDAWVTHRMTCESLQREMHLYRYGAGPYADAADTDALLVSRSEAIMDSENTMWKDVQDSTSVGDEIGPM
jgi:hypothetical protein